jgi:hypothetical protein
MAIRTPFGSLRLFVPDSVRFAGPASHRQVPSRLDSPP